MADEPHLRLLACAKCRSIEELEDFQGPAEYDVILDIAVSRHQPSEAHSPAALVRVKESDWNQPGIRAQMEKQIRDSFDPTASTGFDAGTYAMVNNFKSDAMACFARHQRNPACPDYKSDAKRLVPDTQAERREMGMDRKYDRNPGLTRYLCEYCPVHSLVQQVARKKAGLYDK